MCCKPDGSVGVPQSDVGGQSEEHLMPVPLCCLVSSFAWSGSVEGHVLVLSSNSSIRDV